MSTQPEVPDDIRDRAIVGAAEARTRHRALIGTILTALHDLTQSEQRVRLAMETAGEAMEKFSAFIRAQDAALFEATDDYTATNYPRSPGLCENLPYASPAEIRCPGCGNLLGDGMSCEDCAGNPS